MSLVHFFESKLRFITRLWADGTGLEGDFASAIHLKSCLKIQCLSVCACKKIKSSALQILGLAKKSFDSERK